MKKMFKALLISLITFLPAHAKISTRTHYTRATQKTLRSYYDSLSTAAQSRTFDPFAVLNIGSHDPDEERILKTKQSKIYRKIIRAMRSSAFDMRTGALKTKLFFKSKEGRRIVYETGLFAALMAGGYKIWLQNERAYLQNAALRFDIAKLASDNQKRAVVAQADIAQLKREIAALRRDMDAETKTTRKDLAAELDAAKQAMQILASEVRAPNQAQAAAASVAHGFTAGVASLWRGAKKKKAAFDKQLDAEDASFDKKLASGSEGGDGDGLDDDGGPGAGSGAEAAEGQVPRIWQPKGAGRMVWERG